MTRMVNAKEDFVSEALEGFAATNAARVMPVVGAGIVRSSQCPKGQVAVVSGGGSGHFPAFAGWVGQGFLHGAVCGNIFSSPSQAQVLAVARAADNGGGILFAPINYAGDILHFGGAAEDLRAEGIDVRMHAVTDDIVSGTPDKHLERRGIAGAFLVMKIVGAAAQAGKSLDEVEAVMVEANAQTRSFGVAFGACTLPGADDPLFVVPEGRMAVGLGIHGEPGIDEVPVTTADEATDILMDGLFEERAPVAGQRVAVLVNGLGSTKYDELSVVYRRVAQRLAAVGMTSVAPVVGEFVTSLDMEGFSVSLTYLDDELEQLWLAGANIVCFSRGQVEDDAPRREAVQGLGNEIVEIPEASDASVELAAKVAAAMNRVFDAMVSNETKLGAIDAVAGDGDHGLGMVTGARAAAAAATKICDAGAGAGTTLSSAGHAWSDVAGATSGALWGAGLVAAGQALGDTSAVSPQLVAQAVRAYSDAVLNRGGAKLGEKTMVDAMVPFADELAAQVQQGADLSTAWAAAVKAGDAAAQATADLASAKGRAKLHGARSIGTPDAGAVSFALVVAAIA
ncbi:MAG: dihydroxyacetone kinase family protein [Propionibacteriaceae bacterium]|nr:dihydroxyacetone kinase family protein [Propionibacteriaceae bacterium]